MEIRRKGIRGRSTVKVARPFFILIALTPNCNNILAAIHAIIIAI